MKLLIKSTFILSLMILSAPLLAASLGHGNASSGKAKAATCAACHGPDGNSTTAMFPKLAGQGEPYLEKQLHDFKSGERIDATMQGMAAGLSDSDIADLAAFYAKQTGTVDQADPKLVKQGEAIYRGGILEKNVPACAACHGPSGQGIPSAAFPKLGGQHADYIEKELKAFRAVGRGDLDAPAERDNDSDGDKPGPMTTLAGKLSDMEIKQVASYISGLSD